MAEEGKSGLLLGSLSELRTRIEEKLDALIEEGEKRARSWKDRRNKSARERSFSTTSPEIRERFQEVLRALGIACQSDLEEVRERLDDFEVFLERKGITSSPPQKKRRRRRKK